MELKKKKNVFSIVTKKFLLQFKNSGTLTYLPIYKSKVVNDSDKAVSLNCDSQIIFLGSQLY